MAFVFGFVFPGLRKQKFKIFNLQVAVASRRQTKHCLFVRPIELRQ